MFLSVFDIFKVGVGPSSSHTVGPMIAAAHFLDLLRDGRQKVPGAGKLARLGCSLHGSLSFTGKGHATDRAIMLGLAGFVPATFEANRAEVIEQRSRPPAKSRHQTSARWISTSTKTSTSTTAHR